MKKIKNKNSNTNLLISNNEFEKKNENKDEHQQQEELNKIFIANKIKCIHENDIDLDFETLKDMVNTTLLSANTNVKGGIEFNERCRIGNNIVDFFTFKERLETRGKYNIHFYDFVKNIEEFKKKKFIQNMFTYYSTVKNAHGLKNEYIVMKEVYNICISAINIFRPLVAVEVYTKFKHSVVLDPCAGWGGRAVGAAVCGNIQYFGIDVNPSLKIPYQNMCNFLNSKINTENADNTQKINLMIADATTFDYSQIEPKYDMVFTSPPYYFIEKYNHNKAYNNSKDEMDEQFYVPLFSNTYLHLLTGGCMALNVNRDLYERVCISVFDCRWHDVFCESNRR
jgi:16S rRNA G966 N2-methylase RsmD